MSDSVFAGSPFLRESAAVDHRAAGARDELRERHDRAATDVRTAGRAGDEDGLLDATRRLEQVLAAARRDLGPGDPDTLVVEGSLAVAYLLGDDETRGLALAARNLTSREEALGPDHPATLAAADAVAAAHQLVGRPAEAVTRHEDVLIRRTRVLGESHACTIASRAALAVARVDAGDRRDGAALLSSTLDTADQVLGAAHPVTADVRALLSECLDAQRRAELAAQADMTSQLPRIPRRREEGRRALFDRPSGPLPVVS
ncbi:tetratricopeptide repeat protein [Pseudonocardia sp. C8]|uniref:tetratricopeptide repeat protein n=1 Tax=Pseudonocardia sp. C8 TaxID=2762759 RepID=UPI0016429B84|nr:tetratricopeptide repeat protein [Pseudonocardia sp. C8]MBC3193041.1 tetratricopeptide repeat protein [Pseudonocardia sp. C8]